MIDAGAEERLARLRPCLLLLVEFFVFFPDTYKHNRLSDDAIYDLIIWPVLSFKDLGVLCLIGNL